MKKIYSILQSPVFVSLFVLGSAHATINNIEKQEFAVLVNTGSTALSELKIPCSTAFASCSIPLCTGFPNTGTATISNNSGLPAYNIQPQNLNIFNGNLSLVANTCSPTLPSGSSCQIIVRASPTSPIIDPGRDLIIKGDNTEAITVNISVNGPTC